MFEGSVSFLRLCSARHMASYSVLVEDSGVQFMYRRVASLIVAALPCRVGVWNVPSFCTW